jgi:CAAX protease family protein
MVCSMTSDATESVPVIRRRSDMNDIRPESPGPVRRLVRRYPLSSFFGLAFGLSWLAWLPYVLSAQGLGVLDLQFPRFLGTEQLAGVLPGAYLGPVTAAFLVTALDGGRPGLRHWARRLVHWRVGWRWYAAVLVAVPLTVLVATVALPGALSGVRMAGLTVLLLYLPLLLLQIVTTGLAEEPGWRDFALPRLQRRHGPLTGTAVLGVLWGMWHLPLFLTAWGGGPDVAWYEPVEFVAACVPLSIVMTWVFNRTGGSVPVVVVLHASINTVFSLAWPAMFPALDASSDVSHALLLASSVAAVVLVLTTRGRLGLDQDAAPAAALVDDGRGRIDAAAGQPSGLR